MDGKKQESTAAKRNRSGNFFALRLAVAAYLVYLGYDLLRSFLSGASTLSPVMAWGCGAGFIAAGLAFAVFSFRRYRRESAPENAETEETGKTPDEE